LARALAVAAEAVRVGAAAQIAAGVCGTRGNPPAAEVRELVEAVEQQAAVLAGALEERARVAPAEAGAQEEARVLEAERVEEQSLENG
jgi:hypothetical protein